MRAFLQAGIRLAFLALWCASGCVRAELPPETQVQFVKVTTEKSVESSSSAAVAAAVAAIDPLPEVDLTDENARTKRKTKKQKRKKEDAERQEEDQPPANEEEDAYHVRYETKFAFQNVDEFGLKVKYNKTEHVFYGDTIGMNGTAAPPGYPVPPSTPSYNYPGQPSYQPAPPVTNDQFTPPPPAQIEAVSRLPMVGEDSVEMLECRKMHFLDNEFEKPIEGMCIMCHRGLGTYRYVEGCNRVDCDEFTPVDVMRPFPDCCPKCKGMLPINMKGGPRRYASTPQTRHEYLLRRGSLDRDKKSTDWYRDSPAQSSGRQYAPLTRGSRVYPPVSLLTGHRSGAAPMPDSSLKTWMNGTRDTRPIRD